jgi:competence protein ComK
MRNLSTYDGRREALSILLGENNNIPIYVDKELFLYPVKSIRVYDTVFVNFNEVLSVKMVGIGYTKFIFTNLSEIKLEVSIHKVRKQHARIEKVLEYLSD